MGFAMPPIPLTRNEFNERIKYLKLNNQLLTLENIDTKLFKWAHPIKSFIRNFKKKI